VNCCGARFHSFAQAMSRKIGGEFLGDFVEMSIAQRPIVREGTNARSRTPRAGLEID
jgi:hypothetical protein